MATAQELLGEELINVKDILEFLEQSLHIDKHMLCPSDAEINRQIALMCINDDELKGIYHLTEVHAVSLRNLASLRYSKQIERSKDEEMKRSLEFLRNIIDKPCEEGNKINEMLQKITQMPKEWTVVQLTAPFNPLESIEFFEKTKLITGKIHLSRFDCGQNEHNPIHVMINEPVDFQSGNKVEILERMYEFFNKNGETLKKQVERFTELEKMEYKSFKANLFFELENIIHDLDIYWLNYWNVLFLGKLVNSKDEQIILEKLDKEIISLSLPDKAVCLLRLVALGSSYLNARLIGKVVHEILPNGIDKEVSKKIVLSILDISLEHKTLIKGKRHPVILILDQKFDCLPWESCGTLKNQPISRVPSIHFLYLLFKKYQNTIINGLKIIPSTFTGRYLINPGLDLESCEKRMKDFFDYCLPEWSGISGVKPSSDEVKDLLLSADFFVYSGHGSGVQYFNGEEIQKLHIKSVIFLFGCSSVLRDSSGGKSEIMGTSDHYLIATSPAVVGNLWPVTDVPSDVLASELLSTLFPAKDRLSWKAVSKNQWVDCKGIHLDEKYTNAQEDPNERELLRALLKAKKMVKVGQRAAVVVRGIPVKLADKQ